MPILPDTRCISAWLLLCAFGLGGCASAPPRLPSGGVAADGVHLDSFAWSFLDLEMACRPPVLTARTLVRGWLDRERIDASLWMGVDVTDAFRVRLESIDQQSSRFVLLATHSFGPNKTDEATLLLSGGRWVVRSTSRELVDLVLGVPLSALQLKGVLTGCPTITDELKIERFDDATAKIIAKSGDAAIEIFIRRDPLVSPWAVLAMTGNVPGRPIRWRADPGQRSHGVLESVRLTSLDWNARSGHRFDLTISFDRVHTPAGSGADLFSLPIPESAEPIAIDAVRSHASVPLLAD